MKLIYLKSQLKSYSFNSLRIAEGIKLKLAGLVEREVGKQSRGRGY
jgi:hypothetical protein